jgi:stage IV sporulation protein FA
MPGQKGGSCLANRADQIRKEMAKRRKTRKAPAKPGKEAIYSSLIQDEDPLIYEPPGPKSAHPLFSKEAVLFKILASACLVLLIAIMYKSSNPAFDKAKMVVQQSMATEFQFAKAASWYEEKFGKPAALLPQKESKTETAAAGDKQAYAMPVSGKILTSFSADGRGVMIETKSGASVKAINGGTVIFAGKKKNIGNTVIIQHADSTESWYGDLDKVEVKQYDQIKSGEQVGTAQREKNNGKGEFYFAIKKGKDFIDPIQVIKFE